MEKGKHMKKNLIPALLVVSAAFASSLPNVVAFQDQASMLARSVASPLVWHLWDVLLSHKLTEWVPPVHWARDQIDATLLLSRALLQRLVL